MRDSNFRAVSGNKAAVTITTSLYDRRALDVTSDKPLVNSLNYLTYLVSSSAKVRETLSVDGGIERLIDILQECHNGDLHTDNFTEEKKLLVAWKWTLAFQCIVLVGTRGTEKVRQKVVKAGVLPIIATVLDNYLSLHEGTFRHMHANSTTYSDDNGISPAENVFQSNQPGQLINQNLRNLRLRLTDGITLRYGGTTASSNDFNTYRLVARETSNSNTTISDTNLFGDHNSPNSLNMASLTIDDYENTSVEQLFNLLRLIEWTNKYTFTNGNNNSNNNSSNNNNNNNNNKISNSNANSTTDSSLLLNESAESAVDADLKRAFVILNILIRLRETKEAEISKPGFVDDCEFDMDSNLLFLSVLYARDMEINSANAKIAVRNFTDTGVVIPKDDDIVWSLQLLAYISKYPYLKESIQHTHLDLNMSIRSKLVKLYIEQEIKQESKRNPILLIRQSSTPNPQGADNHIENTNHSIGTGLERFDPSASNSPQMVKALTDDNLILNEDNFSLSVPLLKCKGRYVGESTDAMDSASADSAASVASAAIASREDSFGKDEYCAENEEDPDEYEETVSETSGSLVDAASTHSFDYILSFYEALFECEQIQDKFERNIRSYQLLSKLKLYIEMERDKLCDAVIECRLKQKTDLEKRWNYETYNYFSVDDFDEDKDDRLSACKEVDLFPLVEKFTFLSGSDMYYWAGVIMRNSCRRNELKGGIRQCGNLECGKWEKYPREFLKCRRCKRTKYCSRDCQMKSWHCHRNWCIPSASSSSASSSTTTGNTISIHGNQQHHTHPHNQETTNFDEGGD